MMPYRNIGSRATRQSYHQLISVADIMMTTDMNTRDKPTRRILPI